MIGRRTTSSRRLVIVTFIGVAAGVLAAVARAPWHLTLLVAWDTSAGCFLLLVWIVIARCDEHETAELSTREDPGRHTTGAVLVLAATASLGGVVFGLHAANRADGAMRVGQTAAVMVAVLSSWAVVHTVFLLRYAHLYYRDPPGGIRFEGDDEPDFLDFAYVAFTLGMTFQISDTDVTSRGIRRSVLLHCLLAYLFGTVIIATTINVVAASVS